MTPSDEQLQQISVEKRHRRALWVTTILFINTILYGTYEVITRWPIVTQQAWVAVGSSILIGILTTVSIFLVRRKRVGLGMSLIIGGILLAILVSPFQSAGNGVLLAAVAILVTFVLAVTTLPRQGIVWTLIASSVVGVAVILIDQFGPAGRASTDTGVAAIVITGVLIVAVGIGIIRELSQDRFWKRLSIERKLYVGFGVSLLLGAITAIIGLVGLRTAENEFLNSISRGIGEELSAKELEIAFLEVRRLEQAFLSSWQVEGFESAKSTHLGEHSDQLTRFDEVLSEIETKHEEEIITAETEETEEEVDEALNALRPALTTYEQNFTTVVNLIEQRGGADTGLEGELGKAADTLEAQLITETGQEELIITLLQIRRHEKDYLQHGKQEHIANVQTLIAQLKGQITASPTLSENKKADLGLLLDGYLNSFDQLVALDGEISLITSQLSTAEEEIQGYIEVLLEDAEAAEILIPQAQNTVRQTFILIIISMGVVFIASVALAYRVSRQISVPIRSLTQVANEIASGKLDTRTDITDAEDEIGALGNVLNQMADQVSTLVNTLEHRVTDRTRALATSTEVSRRLSTILNQDELVREVVNQIQQAFNYYHVHIYLWDTTRENLVMMGGTGEAGRLMLASGHYIPAERGLVGRAAETGNVVLVPDVTQTIGWLPNPLLPDTKSEVAVPIMLGEVVMGVLDVQQNIIGGLSQTDAELLQSIAAQVAIALQNARAYTQAQEQAKKEAQRAEIVRKIQGTTSIEEALKVAVREVGRTVGQETFVHLDTMHTDKRG